MSNDLLKLAVEGLENALTAIEDALSIAEMQKEDFALEPWASLEEAAKKANSVLSLIRGEANKEENA